MAENLGKSYAGGGWYPVNDTYYYLEARIVGYGGWVTDAINAEYGDQVEIRLRIASGKGVSPDWAGIAVDYDDKQLTETTERTESGLKLFKVYDSPDASHVAYIPVGMYTVENNTWSHKTGAYILEVTYDEADKLVCRKILIVPPNSEMDFRMILGFAIAGSVCLLILVPITIIIRRRCD